MNTDEPSQNHQARELFAAALDHPAGPVRDAWLARACCADAPLLARVRELLANHLDDDFLAQPAVAAPPVATVEPDATGQRLGPYLLVRKLDPGGMGDVYEAEQTEPIRRRVALKIIKPGMDTRSVLARFEAERQALAKMDHPNIAKVLDAGTTESGRPYFVMELVRGSRITDYCAQHNLSTPQRLELIIKVCQAVQHAHQKGIIHRDLKPSNILVTVQDGVPVPKVIDFGIAKAMGEEHSPTVTVTAQAVDILGLRSPSSNIATVEVYWPGLHQLVANLNAEHDVVCCMGALDGRRYVVETAPEMKSQPQWRDYRTNEAVSSLVIFTNRPVLKQEFYRARLLP